MTLSPDYLRPICRRQQVKVYYILAYTEVGTRTNDIIPDDTRMDITNMAVLFDMQASMAALKFFEGGIYCY